MNPHHFHQNTARAIFSTPRLEDSSFEERVLGVDYHFLKVFKIVLIELVFDDVTTKASVGLNASFLEEDRELVKGVFALIATAVFSTTIHSRLETRAGLFVAITGTPAVGTASRHGLGLHRESVETKIFAG